MSVILDCILLIFLEDFVGSTHFSDFAKDRIQFSLNSVISLGMSMIAWGGRGFA